MLFLGTHGTQPQMCDEERTSIFSVLVFILGLITFGAASMGEQLVSSVESWHGRVTRDGLSPGEEPATCVPAVLNDDTLLTRLELTGCGFVAGPNYQVLGPFGELVLWTDEFEGRDGFSVGIDGKLGVHGMPPPPLDLTLDPANAVSLLISPNTGGVLATTGADGTSYSLEIPANAFRGDAVEVTMTPIAAVSNLPFSGGFHWGMDLAPTGLVLVKGATLTVSPSSALSPEALPGGYRGSGEGFHLYPMINESGDLIFGLSHFSGVLVGSGTDTDVQDLLNQWASIGNTEERYLQEITAALRAEGWNLSGMTEEERATLFLPIFTDWYNTVVLPLLTQAIACGTAECADFWQRVDWAVGTWGTWGEEAIVLQIFDHPGFQTLWSEWLVEARSGFENVYSVWDQSCVQSEAYCDKLRRSDDILELLELLVLLGHPHADAWVSTHCASFLDSVVASVTVDPPTLSVPLPPGVGAVTLTARNSQGAAVTIDVEIDCNTLDGESMVLWNPYLSPCWGMFNDCNNPSWDPWVGEVIVWGLPCTGPGTGSLGVCWRGDSYTEIFSDDFTVTAYRP